MRNILIDLNIIMDFFFNRPGHEKAAEVFGLCAEGGLKGHVCAHEITTLSYFLGKSVKDKTKIRESLSWVMGAFKVLEVNAVILGRALHSEIDDFEDAVIEASAREIGADCIVTRDMGDFRKSSVRATTPEDLLAKEKPS